LRPLYDYAWFVGFGAAATTHLVLMKIAKPGEDMKDGSAP
jgi:cytosine/uracil/thiamine/allantoin permease